MPTALSHGKTLILGCASTGAKFTPNNHRLTGDSTLDSICTGKTIKTSAMASIAEAEALYGMGCRYYHYHARNPLTHEQTTDNEIYQEISRGVQRRCKDLLISFGASRNGGEVRERIRAFGEWERVSQCAIPLHLGGAHYVTIQAAVELQIICELERQLEKQGRVLDLDFVAGPEFLEALDTYEPSDRVQDAQLDTHSTSKGADYGKTSPLIQFQVYRNAIRARQQLVLFHEIEWVQLLRSYAMTRYAVEHPAMRLGSSGQLNITLLFGFSPRLPFPENYAEFKKVVDAAKSLEYDLAEPGVKKRKVTISVGAAVLPQHADQHFKELDVGPRRGTKACAVRRLAAWASQPDSRVDILRVGMEDTPYLVDGAGQVQLADNIQLIGQAIEEVDANGAGLELDHDAIFARMGLLGVQDELLSVQRERPLGAALPEAAPEVTSEAAPEADPAVLVTVG